MSINLATRLQEEFLRASGQSQIDYVIETYKMLKTDLTKEQQVFKKFLLWKKQDFAGINKIIVEECEHDHSHDDELLDDSG